MFSVCSEIFRGDSCVSVEVGYVRVWDIHTPWAWALHWSLLITLLELDACNVTKQILPHSVSVYRADVYTSVYQLCVCACIYCVSSLYVWVSGHVWVIFICWISHTVLHCLLPAFCVCVLFCFVCSDSLGLPAIGNSIWIELITVLGISLVF